MRGYIYRKGGDREYQEGIRPKDIGSKEEVMKWEMLREVIGERRERRKLEEKVKRGVIWGVRVEEKGLKGRGRRSERRGEVIGSVGIKTEDGMWEMREIEINSRRGKRTRKIWMAVEGLPNTNS